MAGVLIILAKDSFPFCMELLCFRYYYLNVKDSVAEYLVIVNSLNFSKKNGYGAYTG